LTLIVTCNDNNTPTSYITLADFIDKDDDLDVVLVSTIMISATTLLNLYAELEWYKPNKDDNV